MPSILSFIILVFIAAYIMGFLSYEVSKMVNPPQVSTDLRQQLETAGLIDKTTNQLDLKALTAATSAASAIKDIRSAGFLKAGEIDTEKLATAIDLPQTEAKTLPEQATPA
jgi:hypothetical protein